MYNIEMQDHKNRIHKKIFLLLAFMVLGITAINAQVSTVKYGKNRVQYKTFKWQYYQTLNFNCYFYDQGQELAKYAAQIAEEELPSLERFVEYSLQRRANIVIYNTFNDMRQTNIGLENNWEDAGGTTQLVNNKMLIYFNGNHEDLRRQIRQGIAKILTQNLLFGDDLGEMAGNRALLDLPQWLIDGYVAYAGENWSTKLDDDLKSEMLSFKYKNFHQFVFERPLLAGHAFWYYIEEKYKRENTTYLLYLARIYKSLKRATRSVTKQRKFKDLLKDFMTYEMDKYDEDIRRRKNYPKGSEVTAVTIGKDIDYFHFNVNPNKRNSSFAVVKYKRGQYKLILDDGFDRKTLLKFGSRNPLDQINPNYPMMAWDPKGTRIAVLYEKESKLQLFVYDVVTRVKPYKRDMTGLFDQVTSMKYLFNNMHLLFGAVRNGHSDIFTYDIENEKIKQITDDVYDELDPSFVAFPNKNGIIFSSNRPSGDAPGGDTALLKNHYNIFMLTGFTSNNYDPALAQITQLTNLKFGNARFPTQYNDNHFTFVSDESGIRNRYAGFFTTRSEGVDTLVRIQDEILRNPSAHEVDSTLRVFKQSDVDSVAIVVISKDSAYVFPLTNYASGIRETAESGAEHQVSEVTRQSDEKILYKLKIDEATLKRRNVTARATTYMKNLMEKSRIAQGQDLDLEQTPSQEEDIFQHEFKPEENKGPKAQKNVNKNSRVLSRAQLYPYKPRKYATDYVMAGFNNDVLGTRYQTYQQGSGPIHLTSNNGFNGMIRMGVADLMEDIKISGGFRISTNLKDNDWLLEFENLRRRIDWGITYYRSTLSGTVGQGYPGKLISNFYVANLSYPFDEIRSVRVNMGVRNDKTILGAIDFPSLKADIPAKKYGLLHAEYVYDNTLNPTMNIWKGVRYKAFMDWNTQLSQLDSLEGRYTFNFGFDARAYYPIYRNFIWAGRVAGDFSWGNQKLIYYLGGVDNWLMLSDNIKSDGTYRYFNPANRPATDQDYAFQTLAVNLRGFIQNAANGNNAVVINSEFRLPVFSTLLSKPINNAFLRNFQLTQFIDLGTAWNGAYDKLARPSMAYSVQDPTVQVKINAPGIGPFLGGYGFGARSTLLGYFLKLDAGWPMSGFFKGKPIWYISMGLDF